MDTPERSQIGGSSKSRFEESPVFNYLSNLSPIKPVKSTHISQTFTSLNFSSLPSIFTSPHVSSHEESRFLRRHNKQDKAHQEFSYIDANGNKENEEFVDVNQIRNYSNELRKELDAVDSLGQSSAEVLTEESNHAIQLSHNMKYESGSPKTEPTAHHTTDENASQSAAASKSADPFAHGTSLTGPTLHGTPSGWESLISDGSDLLMFDSPNFAKDLKALFRSPPVERVGSSLVSQFPADMRVGVSLVSQFPQDTPDFLRTGSTFLVDDDELQTEAHPSESEGMDSVRDDPFDSLTACMTTTQPSDNMDDDDEPATISHRGVRRRCLVFDTNAANRKSFLDSSRSGPMGLQSVEQALKVETRITSKPTGKSSLLALPGIGLHLNALATSADSGAQVSMSSSTTSFLSPTTMQESIHDLFTGTPSDKNADSMVAQGSDDVSLALTSLDEFNQNSPRKKRRKPDGSGDESCKRCNCKKSKCLKLYCECFAAGVYCIGTCACKDCLNKPIHEETVLATRKQIESRNPLAFAPKVIRTTDPLPDVKDEILNTPASARHKRGCNCKKSSCLKKYCECYQGGVGCSVNCRCESCKNMFGTKDGSIPIASPNYDEEETEKVQKKMSNKSLQKIMLQNNEDHNPNTHPETPLRLTRLAVQLPFSSKGKPPRSFIVGSGSRLQSSQKLGKPSYLNPPPKFERNYSSGEQEENEIPEMLLSNGSPNSIIKTSSTNSKRVSSPNSNIGSSARKSNRKLILQSIPAFPSLNQP